MGCWYIAGLPPALSLPVLIYTYPRPGLEPGPLDPEMTELILRPPCLPFVVLVSGPKNMLDFSQASPCKILTEILARISASFWPARLLRSRRPKTRRDSRPDLKISSIFSPRSRRDFKISAAKNSPNISTRLQVRS